VPTVIEGEYREALLVEPVGDVLVAPGMLAAAVRDHDRTARAHCGPPLGVDLDSTLTREGVRTGLAHAPTLLIYA
jgi:hypothetical protein